ncbi:hypothetical protein C8J56DRAFT_885626 [Mycena floridula]|nr:hypothetical protein C8J56DRAFT_885626 [Mycena floridula]
MSVRADWVWRAADSESRLMRYRGRDNGREGGRKEREGSGIQPPSNVAQAGSFAPGLINSNIGAIHGSVFSNNQFNQIHHHHHHPQAEDDADYAEYAKIKVRDIILETELRSGDIHHDLQPDGIVVEIGQIRKYTGRLLQQPHGSILIHKYEGLATRAWKWDFDVLSAVRHPNIIQLYGLCYARNFTALMFHNVQKTAFRKYHRSLSGPSFVTYFGEVVNGK